MLLSSKFPRNISPWCVMKLFINTSKSSRKGHYWYCCTCGSCSSACLEMKWELVIIPNQGLQTHLSFSEVFHRQPWENLDHHVFRGKVSSILGIHLYIDKMNLNRKITFPKIIESKRWLLSAMQSLKMVFWIKYHVRKYDLGCVRLRKNSRCAWVRDRQISKISIFHFLWNHAIYRNTFTYGFVSEQMKPLPYFAAPIDFQYLFLIFFCGS